MFHAVAAEFLLERMGFGPERVSGVARRELSRWKAPDPDDACRALAFELARKHGSDRAACRCLFEHYLTQGEIELLRTGSWRGREAHHVMSSNVRRAAVTPHQREVLADLWWAHVHGARAEVDRIVMATDLDGWFEVASAAAGLRGEFPKATLPSTPGALRRDRKEPNTVGHEEALARERPAATPTPFDQGVAYLRRRGVATEEELVELLGSARAVRRWIRELDSRKGELEVIGSIISA
ncbi:MAG: hypothetical protein H6720_06240 [Sandaracinus sp.]|nr:hypothetical protein [Sandaracinus sp.]